MSEAADVLGRVTKDKAREELNAITDYIMGYWPLGYCYVNPMQAIQVLIERMVKAEAEVERLRKQLDTAAALLETARLDRKHAEDELARLTKRMADAEQRAADAEADAKRLDWLEQNWSAIGHYANGSDHLDKTRYWHHRLNEHSFLSQGHDNTLRACIDAALKGEPR